MKIALFQTNIVWENAAANRERLDKLFAAFFSDEKPTPDLIVLPEMFNTGFSMDAAKIAETMQGETIDWMKTKAAAYGTALLGTVAIRETGRAERAETNPDKPERDRFYNRAVFVTPEGRVSHYDKRHLFSPGGENEQYTVGTERLVVKYKGWRICPLICYDLRFPVWSRCRNDCDLLIYMANWPSVRMQAWDILLPARAVENQCYVVGVNRTGHDPSISYNGHSHIIDPVGSMILTGGPNEQIVVAELELEPMRRFREKLPFWKDADTPD